MLKTQIIASDLSNLTDARYFAAWGVDFMAFNCNPGEENYVEPSVLVEMKEWVEGPFFLGRFNGLSPLADIENLVEESGLDGVILGHFTPIEMIQGIDAEHLFQEYKTENGLKTSMQATAIVSTTKSQYQKFLQTDCFLDISDLDLEVVKDVIDHSSCGLVLRGGDEEKVGFKSYDFLDDVFDILMD